MTNLSNEEIRRYSRHLIMPEFGMEGQRRLKESSVLLIGKLLIKIKPAADGQSFEIATVGEIEDGGPVDLPMDALRLML